METRTTRRRSRSSTVDGGSIATTGTSANGVFTAGNGHTLHYDAAANPTLGAKTYTLSGGGTLTPT